MNLLCALGGHEAGPATVYNGGFHFGRCRRCRCDMIRRGAQWRLVPAGHRVVWKEGRHAHSLEPVWAEVLPILHRGANLPAVRPPFASWCRQLIRTDRRRRRPCPSAGAAEATEANPDAPYPVFLVVAALVGAGLQLLFGFGRAGG
jgi:hypothetical protein